MELSPIFTSDSPDHIKFDFPSSIKTEDLVNSPEHYNKGDIECIDAIKASMSLYAFRGYLKGNIEKYVWRHENKGNPQQDLEKAQWYLNQLIATYKTQTYGTFTFS